MPRYSDYNETAVMRGGYVPRRLNVQGPSIEVFSHALDKIDARHKEALAERNKIMAAVGQLDLNEAEDEFKIDYIRDIQNQIDAASEFGGYSTALTTATQLAGNVLTDPRITGRIKAQQEYKAAKDRVQARTDIGQVTKDRWLEQNPYTYQDKYDSNGNVIGGTGFKPNWTPVNRVDLTEVYARLKQLVAPKTGNINKAMFLGADGKPTNDPTKGVWGVIEEVNGKWQEVSYDRLKNAFDQLWKEMPNAMQSILQDRDDRKWQYDKADEEGKKSFIGSDILDDAGRLLSPEDYLNKRVSPVLHEMAYRDTDLKINHGDAYAKMYAAQREELKAREKAEGLANMFRTQAQVNTEGDMIKLDYTKTIGDAYNAVQQALEDIKKYFPRYTADPTVKKRIENGQFNMLAEGLRKVIDRNNPNYNAAFAAINTIEHYADVYNKYTSGLDDTKKDAIGFVTALDSGGNTPANNSWSSQYNNYVNQMFPDGKPIVFISQDDKHYDKLINNLGGLSELKNLGMRPFTQNGKKGIVLTPKSDLMALYRAAVPDRFWSFSSSDYYKLNDDGTLGNVVTGRGATYQGRASNYTGSMFPRTQSLSGANLLTRMAQVYERAKASADEAITSSDMFTSSIQNLPAEPGAAGEYQFIMEAIDKGLVEKKEDIDKLQKDFNEQFINEARVTSLNHYDVYSKELGSGDPLTIQSEEEKTELTQELWNAIANGKATPVFTPDPMGRGTGGTTWVIDSYKDEDKTVHPGRHIYVRGMYSGAHANYIANHPEFKAVSKFQNARNANTDIHMVGVMRLQSVNNNGSSLRLPNNKRLNLNAEQTINAIKVSDIYNNVVANIQQLRNEGTTIKEEECDKAGVDLAKQLGLREGTSDFNSVSRYISGQLRLISR